MKRFFLLSICLIMTVSLLFAGCGDPKAEREEELKGTLESIGEDLQSNFPGSEGDFSLVSEFLKSWANSNDLTVSENAESYMVISNPATKGFGKSDSTVLQCQIDTKEFSSSLQTLSTAMTALLGPENHGDITLIVTENSNGQYIGAAKIKPEYLSCDNFINLNHSDEAKLYTGGCLISKETMNADYSYESPAYPNAYEIKIKTAYYSNLFDFDNKQPNPIEVIGDLLASEKSSGQLFQLASFTCESSDGYTPHSATAVVVIDSNDIKSFTSKFNSSYNKVKKKYENIEENFVYTMTETDLPQSVINSETSDNIISLMYTLKTGTYMQDEESGEIITSSAISDIRTKNGEFKLTALARSLDKDNLEELENVFRTTSGLCNIGFKASEARKTWSASPDSKLSSFFTEAIGADSYVSDNMLSSCECDILYNRANGLNIISYEFDAAHKEPALLNTLHFLDNLVE